MRVVVYNTTTRLITNIIELDMDVPERPQLSEGEDFLYPQQLRNRNEYDTINIGDTFDSTTGEITPAPSTSTHVHEFQAEWDAAADSDSRINILAKIAGLDIS